MTVTLSLFAGAGAQFLDNNGNPLSGGKIYTYQAGTTTPLTTYTTNSGTIAHTNPIVLDAAGRVPSGGEIWLTLGIGYKFVVKTFAEVLIATYDNIPSSAQPPAANDADSIMYEQGYTVTAGSFVIGKMYRIATLGTTDFTLIGAINNVIGTHFIATGVGTGTGAAELSQTVENKLRETVSVKDFGAVGDGVTDDTASIQAALDYAASINGADIYFPRGEYICNGTLSLNTPIAVSWFGEGADNTAQGGTIITYTGTAAAFVTFTGIDSRMYTMEGIHFRASNAGFTGTVLKTGGFDVRMSKCCIDAPGTAQYLLDLNFNSSVDVHLDQVRFLGSQYAINGRGSNAVILTQCAFDNQTVACVLNTGQAWGFDGCSFEPLKAVGGLRAPSAILNTVAGLGCSVRNCWFGDASDAAGTVVGSANWITWQGDGIEVSGCYINGAGFNKYGAIKINGSTNGVDIRANYFSNFDYIIDLGSGLAYNVTVMGNRTRNMQSLNRGTIAGGTFLRQQFDFVGTFQTGTALQNSGQYESQSTGTAFRASGSPSVVTRVDANSLGFATGNLSNLFYVQSSALAAYKVNLYATQPTAFPDVIGWKFTTQAGAGVERDTLLINPNAVSPGVNNTIALGTSALRWADVWATNIRPGSGTVIWTNGSGTPEGTVTAPVGSLYTRTDGGAGTTLYVKETGSGNTGWVAK